MHSLCCELTVRVVHSHIATCMVTSVSDIVHFDIKADNILLDPVDDSVSDSEFYNPPAADTLPFGISLADFGESEIFASDDDMYSGRNRGTEPIKSPEMLTLAWVGA